jgi:hypothetical protein
MTWRPKRVVLLVDIVIGSSLSIVPTKAANFPIQIIGVWAFFGENSPAVVKKFCDSYRKNPKDVSGEGLVFHGTRKFSYGGYMDYVDTNVSVKQLASDKWQITDRHYDDGEGGHTVGYKNVRYEVINNWRPGIRSFREFFLCSLWPGRHGQGPAWAVSGVHSATQSTRYEAESYE